MKNGRYWFVFFLTFSTHFLFAQDLQLSARGYDMHAELNWEEIPSAIRYQIWRKDPGMSDFMLIDETEELKKLDWTGREDETPDTYEYFVQAVTLLGVPLAVSDTLTVTILPLTDDQFMDMVQEYTLRYFYDYAHPVSGMTRERLGSGDLVTTGGSGFGTMAILVGVERGWITREEAVQHFLKLVSFLQFADTYHGVFPHWMDGTNGNTFPFSQFDNGGDLVETSFLMQGLLCVRKYFDRDNPQENAIRSVITSLWEAVEWDHYTRNNSGVLYWHWSPEYQFAINLHIRGYNEALITYLLAIASPTHPIPESYYHNGWAGGNYENGNTWFGHKLFVGPPLGGPLFFAHYSFQGFDPRNKKDAYCNYFEQNRNHTLINRGWCITNPLNHDDYSEDIWGLTASDNPWGYAAQAPGGTTDNGTITPTAAASSIPYTPSESLSAMRAMYRNYGLSLWGEYGFKDAFNPGANWFASSYLAIDQGPIINMIENYRSALLWDLFMQDQEVLDAVNAIGFVPDITSSEEPGLNEEWQVSPTIVSDQLHIRNLSGETENIRVEVVDLKGDRRISESIEIKENPDIYINLTNCQTGIYIVSILSEGKILYATRILVQN